jgi:hypothetical protein
VLFAGGELNGGPAPYQSNAAVVYDPTGGPVRTGAMHVAREYQTATLLQNGDVLIAGGEDSDLNPLASAELFKP